MKQHALIFTLAISALMAGCSSMPGGRGEYLPPKFDPAAANKNAADSTNANAVNSPSAERVVVEDRKGRVEVEKVKFRAGVSSASVESLGKRFGCTGSTGAGLLTASGPVEVYRMQCDNGTTFMARCEFRQCRPMR